MPKSIYLGKSPMDRQPVRVAVDGDGDIAIAGRIWITREQAKRLAMWIQTLPAEEPEKSVVEKLWDGFWDNVQERV